MWILVVFPLSIIGRLFHDSVTLIITQEVSSMLLTLNELKPQCWKEEAVAISWAVFLVVFMSCEDTACKGSQP